MFVYIASDHAGYEIKEKIKQHFNDLNFKDFGAFEFDEKDNYPDFIHPCIDTLSLNLEIEDENIAIILGGSGTGEAMIANRYKGVRAVILNNDNLEIIKLGREHNDANALSMGVRFVNFEIILQAIEIFLKTKFDKNSRHQARVDKIDQNK